MGALRTSLFSSFLVPPHKRSLIPIPRTLISPTISIPNKSSLVLQISLANRLCFPIHFVTGAGSSTEPEESSSTSTSISSVFVKGLPQSVSEGRLRKAFSEFGEVTDAKIIIKKKTRESLGYGYVWFAREECAQQAAEEMNGKVYSG